MQVKKFEHIRNISLVMVLAAFVAGGILYAGQDVKAFVGDWNGAVYVGDMEIGLIFHFKLNDAGELTGTIDSPEQGAFDIAMANINVDGKKISFGIDDPNVQGEPFFDGALDETGTIIEGDFSQGGGEGTFKMEKEK